MMVLQSVCSTQPVLGHTVLLCSTMVAFCHVFSCQDCSRQFVEVEAAKTVDPQSLGIDQSQLPWARHDYEGVSACCWELERIAAYGNIVASIAVSSLRHVLQTRSSDKYLAACSLAWFSHLFRVSWTQCWMIRKSLEVKSVIIAQR